MSNMPKRKDGEKYFGRDHQDHVEYLRDFFKEYYVDYYEENKHRYPSGNFKLSGHLYTKEGGAYRGRKEDTFEIQGGGQCISLCADGTWDLEDTTGG